MTSDRTYIIVLCGAVLWCALIMIAPLLAMLGGVPGLMGDAMYKFFHSICHQLDERSFHILGKPLAVCIRCLSIYAGFLTGTIAYPFVGRLAITIISRRSALLLSVLPMIVDVMLDALGFHSSTTFTRLITGSVFGIVVPFFIIPAAREAMHDLTTHSQSFPSDELKKGTVHA